jgi:hypothetical protein
MKATLLICLTFLFSHSLSAIELTYGNGEFGMNAGIGSLFSSNVKLSTNTWSLAEHHKNIRKSKLYYQFQFDYFNSDTVDKMTDFASSPISSSLPIIGSSPDDMVNNFTQIPVPSDYRIRGINFDIGLGYDLIKHAKTTFGIAFNTGLSTPFMKIRNMKNTANLVIDLLDSFDTKVETYKLGGSIYGEYAFNEQLSVLGGGSLNFQTGKMENDTLRGDVTIDGFYQSLHINLKYSPTFLKRAFLIGGYRYNRWDYGSTTVDTPIGRTNIAQNMDIIFDSSNIHIGAGYRF